MNLSSLIARFATDSSYVLTRRATATFVKGKAVAGASSTLDIVAAIQPASGRDLLQLPEGRRSRETYQLFTSTAIEPGGKGKDYEADEVAFQGRQWVVMHVEKWQPWRNAAAYRALIQAKEE